MGGWRTEFLLFKNWRRNPPSLSFTRKVPFCKWSFCILVLETEVHKQTIWSKPLAASSCYPNQRENLLLCEVLVGPYLEYNWQMSIFCLWPSELVDIVFWEAQRLLFGSAPENNALQIAFSCSTAHHLGNVKQLSFPLTVMGLRGIHHLQRIKLFECLDQVQQDLCS